MSATRGHNRERELLELIANGNEKAFKCLFDNYHLKLGGYIFRLTNSYQLSQEIVQDSFLKIWNDRQSLSNVNNFNAYLFTVARNYTLNVLKQIARERMRKKAWEQDQENELIVLAEELASYKEFAAAMLQAVDQLPPRQKSVFQLSRNKGMSHEQIATQLNVSLETVKKHMVLALKSIRNYINTYSISLLIIFLHGL